MPSDLSLTDPSWQIIGLDDGTVRQMDKHCVEAQHNDIDTIKALLDAYNPSLK